MLRLHPTRGGFGGVVIVVRLKGFERESALTFTMPHPIHRLVANDSQQPRSECPSILEPLQCLICLHKRILGDVLGLGVIARDEVGHPHGHALVPAYEFVVRLWIPPPGSTDQLRLVQRFTSRFLHRRSRWGSREPPNAGGRMAIRWDQRIRRSATSVAVMLGVLLGFAGPAQAKFPPFELDGSANGTAVTVTLTLSEPVPTGDVPLVIPADVVALFPASQLSTTGRPTGMQEGIPVSFEFIGDGVYQGNAELPHPGEWAAVPFPAARREIAPLYVGARFVVQAPGAGWQVAVAAVAAGSVAAALAVARTSRRRETASRHAATATAPGEPSTWRPECVINDASQARVVRPPPVDPSTRTAFSEAAHPVIGPGRDLADDVGAVDRYQRPVTTHATGERADSAVHLITSHNLAQLLSGGGSPNERAVDQCAVLQQPDVTRQEDSLLLEGRPHEVAIGRIARAVAVETQEP